MKKWRVGVISDTHGLVRPEALKALEGTDLIVHAGDIGKRQVLEELGKRAPVVAVRGNVDRGEWAEVLPATNTVELGDTRLYVLHNLKELELEPQAENINAVISGHSHQPAIIRKDGVLFVNPGSAGPRRFKLPISLAMLEVQEKSLDAHLITLTL